MSGPAITPEALSLSASLFTSSIDAWIPADFGTRRTEAQRAAEFNIAMRRAATMGGENDKRGLGHPDILASGSSSSRGPSGGAAGLMALDKRLRLRREAQKGTKLGLEADKEKTGLSAGNRPDEHEGEDEEEEESRTRIVGKGKRKSTTDLLTSKKAKMKLLQAQPQPRQHPAATAPPLPGLEPSPRALSSLAVREAGTAARSKTNYRVDGDDRAVTTIDSPASFALDQQTTTTTSTSSPGGSGDFPFPGPVALDSPRARRVLALRAGAFTGADAGYESGGGFGSQASDSDGGGGGGRDGGEDGGGDNDGVDVDGNGDVNGDGDGDVNGDGDGAEERGGADSDVVDNAGPNKHDRVESTGSGDTVQRMSKTQRRREKRKLAKQGGGGARQA